MVRTRGGSRLRPKVRFSTPEQEEQAPVTIPEEPQGFRRYQTRIGPQAPSLVPQRRSWRARPSKHARISGPGESSSSQPQPSPSLAEESSSPLLSPASRIRRPLFVGTPILGNVGLHARDFHGESFYDVPTLAADYTILPAAVHDTAAVLLSPGGASVLPLHDFPGSAESAGAPIHH